MGMVYVFSAIALAVVLLLTYWFLGFVGVANHYSLAVVGLIFVSVIVVTLFPNFRSHYALSGEITSEGDQPLMFEKVDRPDTQFHRNFSGQQTKAGVFEVIPEQNFEIATRARAFDDEPLRTLVFKFSEPQQSDRFFANRRGENYHQQAVMWTGEVADLQTATPLELDDHLIRQVVKVSADRFVLATSQQRENWKSKVLVIDANGKILNTLYTGTDLDHRDRAYEARLYAGDTDADISIDRVDANEYLIPFALGDRGIAVVIGTRTKNYDSFFSSQGFYLPTQSQVFWFDDAESLGVHSASFPIKAGMPLASAMIGEQFYLQTLDPRDRENPLIHYYQLKP